MRYVCPKNLLSYSLCFETMKELRVFPHLSSMGCGTPSKKGLLLSSYNRKQTLVSLYHILLDRLRTIGICLYLLPTMCHLYLGLNNYSPILAFRVLLRTRTFLHGSIRPLWRFSLCRQRKGSDKLPQGCLQKYLSF